MKARTVLAAVVGAVLFAGLATPAHAADGVKPVPPGFHWGVATSGYQSEGDEPPSNWSAYDDKMEPYGNSVDFLHRYAEDIANAKSLGVDTFRFGVEWARVEPKPGVYDPAAFAFYDKVVAEIERQGMKPMITLSHWVHPAWFTAENAWSNKAAVNQFVDYATHVVTRYAGQGATWITFNEPVIYLLHELQQGSHPLSSLALRSKLVQAHNKTYALIHRLDPGAMVSSNIAYIPGAEPALDLLFLNQMKVDFIGIDYYYSVSLDNLSAFNAFINKPYAVKPEPEGLYYALKSVHQRFPKKPIWIVENGMSTDNGKPRADGYTRSDYIRDHIYWMQKAIADGIPVIGYNYWTITDNYEWGSYEPRFGLWSVDALTDPTLTRKPTDGVATYTDVIAHGGDPAAYQPVIKPGFCNVDNLASCLNVGALAK